MKSITLILIGLHCSAIDKQKLFALQPDPVKSLVMYLRLNEISMRYFSTHSNSLSKTSPNRSCNWMDG